MAHFPLQKKQSNSSAVRVVIMAPAFLRFLLVGESSAELDDDAEEEDDDAEEGDGSLKAEGDHT